VLSGLAELEQLHEKSNTEHSHLDVTAPHAGWWQKVGWAQEQDQLLLRGIFTVTYSSENIVVYHFITSVPLTVLLFP